MLTTLPRRTCLFSSTRILHLDWCPLHIRSRSSLLSFFTILLRTPGIVVCPENSGLQGLETLTLLVFHAHSLVWCRREISALQLFGLDSPKLCLGLEVESGFLNLMCSWVETKQDLRLSLLPKLCSIERKPQLQI